MTNQELVQVRDEIDRIDAEFMRLFTARIAAAENIALIKGREGIGVYDKDRERRVIEGAQSRVDDSLRDEAALLMKTLMEISRRRQVAVIERMGK